MDYIVAWSGAAERDGSALIKSLTGYLGRSSLFICESRAQRDVQPARLHEDERGRLSRKAYDQRQRFKAKRARASARYHEKHRDERLDYHAARYQAKKAEQQPLFGEA